MQLSLPTVLALLAVVGAGAFAAGQSLSTPPPSQPARAAAAAPENEPQPEDLPTEPAEPVENRELPPGHPPIDPNDPNAAPAFAPAASSATPPAIRWRVPPHWQEAPNASPFRLATYRVPRAPGDAADADVSVTRAGGSVDANAARWIGQFDADGQRTASRATKTVAGLAVTIVQVQGTYSAGMGDETDSRPGWALLGAIVATPGTPYFFKVTGPAKTVAAARPDLDALVASITKP